jgi:hypothetical protein
MPHKQTDKEYITGVLFLLIIIVIVVLLRLT